MTDRKGFRPQKGLGYRTEEIEALALKWPTLSEEDKAYFLENLSGSEKKRLNREVKKAKQDEDHYKNKLTTRGDVIDILQLYIHRNLRPMAERLDAAEAAVAYLRLPWYKKLRLFLMTTAAKMWDRLERLLDRWGIRLVVMEDEDEDSANADVGAQRGEGQAPGGDAREAGEGSQGDRVYGDDHGLVVKRGGKGVRSSDGLVSFNEADQAEAERLGRITYTEGQAEEEGGAQEEGSEEASQEEGLRVMP